MKTQQDNALELLYQALGTTWGISISVSDPVRAKQALYRARAKSGDPALDRLQIRTSPALPNEELWIVKENPNGAEG